MVIRGTRTQVLADSMVIAASALSHCATKAPFFVIYFTQSVILEHPNMIVAFVKLPYFKKIITMFV